MKDSIFLFDDSLPGESNALEVYVFYSLGGINYFTYKEEPRGFYVSVKAVERKSENGYSSTSFIVGGNNPADGKLLVKKLKRNNKKALAEVAGKVFAYFEANKDDVLKVYKAGRSDLMVDMIRASVELKEVA